jgi:hypothetical protein
MRAYSSWIFARAERMPLTKRLKEMLPVSEKSPIQPEQSHNLSPRLLGMGLLCDEDIIKTM